MYYHADYLVIRSFIYLAKLLAKLYRYGATIIFFKVFQVFMNLFSLV